MHDIGKIGIPEHVLLETGSLTPEEWEVMKGHSVVGAKILCTGKSPYLQMTSSNTRSATRSAKKLRLDGELPGAMIDRR
jgi:response regulator RpfG family c-di-GMP phosphodiesterase